MKFNKTNKQSGFELIEVLIVIAIIWVLAAIAIPNFAKAKKQHDERMVQEQQSTTNSKPAKHNLVLPAGVRVVSVSTSSGEMDVTTRPAKNALEQAQVYTVTGYRFDHDLTVIDTYTITEQ